MQEIILSSDQYQFREGDTLIVLFWLAVVLPMKRMQRLKLFAN